MIWSKEGKEKELKQGFSPPWPRPHSKAEISSKSGLGAQVGTLEPKLKKQKQVACTCNPRTEEMGTGRPPGARKPPRGLLARQLELVSLVSETQNKMDGF